MTEPLHLNLIALLVAIAGSFRAKVVFDLVLRQQHAFSLLKAADYAKELGIPRITAIEFGVANGAGLMNICRICRRVTDITGVEFDIVGFDTGKGMPPPRDYRDHPEYYNEHDYSMRGEDDLRRRLPDNCRLVIGDVSRTVQEFLRECRSSIGFVSIDVDYYWSTVEMLRILDGDAVQYLPLILIYVDDIENDGHSIFAGEQLAIEEFNGRNPMRKIARFGFLRQKRVFQRANWIDHIYLAHIFDHPARTSALEKQGEAILGNPYRF
ncbi:MAG: hypothetical protein ACREYF_24635 [Gammaproteobacteria bacterium]